MADLSKLERKVKNVIFPGPIVVAGGIFKTVEQVMRVAASDVIPEWGSFTTAARSGNGGRDYHAEYHLSDSGESVLLYTQNSLGLPNPGMDYAERHAPALIAHYRNEGKPLILNVSGEGPDDLLELVKRAVDCEFDVITANGACPNSKGVPILCYDPESVDRFFDRAEQEIGETDQVLFWKVSTGMPRTLLEHNRKRVAESKTFTGIVCGNTIPYALDYNTHGKTVILTNNNITRGGLGGPAIRPIALDHTEYCASQMPSGKIVVMTGGIGSAYDVLKAFRAGATLVGMNSAFREAKERPEFISQILLDLLKTPEFA